MKYQTLALSTMLLFVGCDSTPTPTQSLVEIEPFVYERLGEGKLSYEHITSPRGENNIRVIDASEKKSWSFSPGVFGRPSGSPDGQHFIYLRSNKDSRNPWDIYISDSRGNNETKLTNFDGGEGRLGWMPDGERILYIAAWKPNDLDSQGGIVVQPLTLNSGQIGPVSTFSYPCDVADEPLSSSPSGNTIFSSGACYINGTDSDPVRGIISVKLDGSPFELLRAQSNLKAPTWSPDGQHIAFIQYTPIPGVEEYYETKVVVVDSGGNNEETLAVLEAHQPSEWCCGNNISLAWAPDGSKIAFNNHEGKHTSHIYVVDRDGSGLTKISSTLGSTDRSLSWGR